MAATKLDGQVTWEGERDDEGHRTWFITHHVKTDSFGDGPAIVMQCPGLPALGSTWNFDNDVDVWAFRTPYTKVKIRSEKEGDPNKHWLVTHKFTTKPLWRCQDATIENPLLEPQKVSGTFSKYTKEVAFDKDNVWLVNSAWQPIVGKDVEFDFNRPTVHIEQNVPLLQLDLFSQMVDTVNTAPLWGLPARCVKLSNVSWERKYNGVCNLYYTRAFDFDVQYPEFAGVGGFDRKLTDIGTMALRGYFHQTTGVWTPVNVNGSPPVATNPTHYTVIKEPHHGENVKRPLDGAGKPLTNGASVITKTLRYYKESNFLLLGIPTSF